MSAPGLRSGGRAAVGRLRPPRAILLIILLVATAAPLPAGAQATADGTAVDTRPDGPMLHVPRLAGEIVIDGRVDEEAWTAIEPLPAVMHIPTLGMTPTERTEFRLAYDDEYLYFSCRNYDSEPSRIQAPTLRRDAANFTNDWCVLQLDTFNDEETGLGFGTTPAGVRTDVIWPNDGNAGGNFTWNTFWDVAVHRDDAGWYAELRIPISSLRFQTDEDGQVVMGVSAWRLIARKNELVIFPAIDNRWGGSSFTKASQYRDMAFQGIEPSRPVYVTPYALGAAGRRWGLDAAGVAYRPDDQRDVEIGGDIKYSLASNLTLDLTFNTDFAQVEADDQQVNLTRFSLFFPEKRLFFQERGETFGFSVGGNERLFHSRRIGLVGGEPVPILAGARVVGRLGEWDLGLLDMQTGRTSLSPSENLGVLRLRRRVLNQNSYVGGIVTTRFAEGGEGHNVLYGTDAILRLFGQDFLTVNWSQSFGDTAPLDPGAAPGPEVTPFDRALIRLLWERRGLDGPTYSVELARAGDTFEPGLGFLVRRDYSKLVATSGYGWRPGEASPLLRYDVGLDGTLFTRNAAGSVETAIVAADANFILKSGRQLTGSVTGTYEDLLHGFELADDALVPEGEYRFITARLAYSPSQSRLLRTSGSLQAGQFYDGRIVSAAVSPVWFPSRHLELSGTYEVSRISFPDRDQAFTAHVARLRTQVMATAALSGAAFVQYNSATDRVSGNVRLRYNPSEGHDLYLVWNEQLYTDRFAFDPVPPPTENRALMVKYARTLAF